MEQEAFVIYCTGRGQSSSLENLPPYDYAHERDNIVVVKVEDLKNCQNEIVEVFPNEAVPELVTVKEKDELLEYSDCDYCGLTFPTKKSLRRHILIEHLQILAHVCKICSESFPSFYQMIRHKKIVHNIKSFPCHCGRRFQSPSFLMSHRRTHNDILTCNSCGKTFTSRTRLAIHSAIKHDQFTSDEKKYWCDFCFNSYSCQNALRSHKRIHTEDAFTCEHCSEKFMSKFAVKEHVLAVHLMKRVHKCKICNKKFGQKASLTIHKHIHGGKMFSCKLCDKKFTFMARLKRHMTTHSSERPYSCDQCGLTSKDLSNLRKHVLTKHAESSYICNECGEGFRTKNRLEVHIGRHIGVDPFMCGTCGQSLSSKGALKLHVRARHLGIKPYVCPLCGKSCRDKVYHMRMHRNEKPFTCDSCSKAFRSKHHLELHTRIHTGVKPFTCEICGKSFTFKSNLNAHARIHTGLKLYKCPHCLKSFPYQSGLRRHIVASVCQQKEKKEIILPTLIRPNTLSSQLDDKRIFTCELCKKEFYHKSSFNRHSKLCPLRYDLNATELGHKYKCDTCGRCYKNRSSLSMHRRMHSKKFISCGICSKPFIRKSHYKEHMLSKHTNIKPYKCGYCPRTFHLKHILARHMRKAHAGEDATKFETVIDEATDSAYKLTRDVISNFIPDESKPFKCKECGKSFKKQENLEKHVHMKPKRVWFRCNHCTKCYGTEKQLDAHVNKQHEKKFKCCYCPEAFMKKPELDTHMETHWGPQQVLFVPGNSQPNYTYQPTNILEQAYQKSIVEYEYENRPIVVEYQKPDPPIVIEYQKPEPPVVVEPVYEEYQKTDILEFPKTTYTLLEQNKNYWESETQMATSSLAYENFNDEPLSFEDEQSDVIYVIDAKYEESKKEEETWEPKKDDTKPSFSCNLCPKSYATEKSLKSHKLSHNSATTSDCTFCGKTLTSKTLRSHIKTVHMAGKLLKCPTCPLSFMKKKLLDSHIKDEHPEILQVSLIITPDGVKEVKTPKKRRGTSSLVDKPYKCECGKAYFTRTSLSSHKRVHTGRALQCVFCEKQFIKRHQLKDHVALVHMKIRNYPCEYCDLKFARKNSLEKHTKTHFEISDLLPPGEYSGNPQKPFKCMNCEKNFGSKTYLAEHMKLHTGKGIPCGECGKIFTKEKALTAHVMAIHQHVRPFQCEFCTKSFTQRCNYSLHKRKHTGEKMKECSQCGKKFTSLAPLKRHLRSHTGQKPFSCTICPRTFSDASNLKKHTMIHTGKKRYSCAQCPSGFSTKEALGRHVTSVHDPNTPVTCHRCKECDQSFQVKAHFNKHMKLHRETKKKFLCELCEKRFSTKQSLITHIKVHLGMAGFVCAGCGQVCPSKLVLTKHILRHEKGG